MDVAVLGVVRLRNDLERLPHIDWFAHCAVGDDAGKHAGDIAGLAVLIADPAVVLGGGDGSAGDDVAEAPLELPLRDGVGHAVDVDVEDRNEDMDGVDGVAVVVLVECGCWSSSAFGPFDENPDDD